MEAKSADVPKADTPKPDVKKAVQAPKEAEKEIGPADEPGEPGEEGPAGSPIEEDKKSSAHTSDEAKQGAGAAQTNTAEDATKGVASPPAEPIKHRGRPRTVTAPPEAGGGIPEPAWRKRVVKTVEAVVGDAIKRMEELHISSFEMTTNMSVQIKAKKLEGGTWEYDVR
jgi:hypothetical protein